MTSTKEWGLDVGWCDGGRFSSTQMVRGRRRDDDDRVPLSTPVWIRIGFLPSTCGDQLDAMIRGSEYVGRIL